MCLEISGCRRVAYYINVTTGVFEVMFMQDFMCNALHCALNYVLHLGWLFMCDWICADACVWKLLVGRIQGS